MVFDALTTLGGLLNGNFSQYADPVTKKISNLIGQSPHFVPQLLLALIGYCVVCCGCDNNNSDICRFVLGSNAQR
jgi:hypothetical protein